MKATESQVKLSKLIFTHSWEDPAIDERALRISPGETVFTITSGGCNTLGFLRFDPEVIHCVDINPAQTYLMELKQASFRHLDHSELLGFFGVRIHTNRKQVYQNLKGDLSSEAKNFWDDHSAIIRKGIFMNGRYERFVKLAGWLLRRMQGGAKTKAFFRLKTLSDQKSFYEERWNNSWWRWVFKVMFNKDRLAKKGLNAEYFHFDDGSASFSESFQRRASHAMCDLDAATNYFLMLYLLGYYDSENNAPAYLLKENFDMIKSRIDRIKPVTADSKYWLQEQPSGFVDAFALSNICELMDETDTLKLFSEVYRTSKPKGRIVFRNLMVPRDTPETLKEKIVKDVELSKELQYNDRSFVYGKVATYDVVK